MIRKLREKSRDPDPSHQQHCGPYGTQTIPIIRATHAEEHKAEVSTADRDETQHLVAVVLVVVRELCSYCP